MQLCAGNKIGQATVIRHWRFDDGTAGGPNAPEPAVNAVMLQEAQEYATQQAWPAGALARICTCL